IELIESGAQPFLLAVPTDATGALDAATLVNRIAELEKLDVTPAPIDLAQALLRVTITTDARVLRAAEDLRSHAGRELARWLSEGGLPHQNSTPQDWPEPEPRWVYPARPALDTRLPAPAAALLGPEVWNGFFAAPFWVAQLPHHRDEAAARIETCPGTMLVPLAESGGPAGFAVYDQIMGHLESDSVPAVDAFLLLAVRGDLDIELFATLLHVRLRSKGCRTNRIIDALRMAAETGAYATVWSVLEHALPVLLRDEPIRTAGALLALAIECASKCGAKGRIPEVDALAARKGSTQTVKNAMLLRDILN
ncbi:hypothetical protein ACFQ07_33045, partial [Actinomadura adrarensis]